MVDVWPFYGTRPYNQDAKTLIAPSTDHLSIENIEIFRKNNYFNYLKVLNPVGQLKEKDSLTEAREHFKEMKDNDVIKKDGYGGCDEELLEHIINGGGRRNYEDVWFNLIKEDV